MKKNKNVLQLAKELLESCVIVVDGVGTPITAVEVPQYNIIITKKIKK